MDYLLITPEGLQWEYGGNWALVVMHEGVHPTLVNGIAWWPDWADPVKSSVLETNAFAEGVGPGSLTLTDTTGECAQAAITTSDHKVSRVRLEDIGLGTSTATLRLSRTSTFKP